MLITVFEDVYLPLLFASLPLDFPRPDGCVCCGGFPSHCDGKVCFPRTVLCEEELAVRHIWNGCLHQLYDHHVSQRGRCLDEHHLACLHILSNNSYLEICSRNYLTRSQKGISSETPLCLPLTLMTLLNLSPVNAYECYHLTRCMKRWPTCWQI